MAVVNNPTHQDRLHLRAKPSRNATCAANAQRTPRWLAAISATDGGGMRGMARGYMEAKSDA